MFKFFMRSPDDGAGGTPPATPPVPPAEPPAPPAEPPKPDPSKIVPPEKKTVTKEHFDRVASELAEAKRQIKERMTAEELAAAQAEEAKMELATLRRERETAKLEVALAKSGIENSAEIAELFADGEIGQGIAALTKAKDKQIAELQNKLTVAEQKGATTPPTGEPPHEFAGKSLSELMQMANQSPAMEAKVADYMATLNKKKE